MPTPTALLIELCSIPWQPVYVIKTYRTFLKSNSLLTTLNNAPDLRATFSYVTKDEVTQFTYLRRRFEVHATREVHRKTPGEQSPAKKEKIILSVFAFRDNLIENDGTTI